MIQIKGFAVKKSKISVKIKNKPKIRNYHPIHD